MAVYTLATVKMIFVIFVECSNGAAGLARPIANLQMGALFPTRRNNSSVPRSNRTCGEIGRPNRTPGCLEPLFRAKRPGMPLQRETPATAQRTLLAGVRPAIDPELGRRSQDWVAFVSSVSRAISLATTTTSAPSHPAKATKRPSQDRESFPNLPIH